jgi:hypothetical protein
MLASGPYNAVIFGGKDRSSNVLPWLIELRLFEKVGAWKVTNQLFSQDRKFCANQFLWTDTVLSFPTSSKRTIFPTSCLFVQEGIRIERCRSDTFRTAEPHLPNLLVCYANLIFYPNDEQLPPCVKFFAVNVLDVSGVVSGTWIKITWQAQFHHSLANFLECNTCRGYTSSSGFLQTPSISVLNHLPFFCNSKIKGAWDSIHSLDYFQRNLEIWRISTCCKRSFLHTWHKLHA